MDGPPTATRKNDVCYVKKKTGDTVINAEVPNAKFVCSNTSQFLLIEKKKKRLKTTLASPSLLPLLLLSQSSKERSFPHPAQLGCQSRTVEMVTTITQQAPAPSFSRTGNVIFPSLLGAHLKTNQDDL